MNRRHLIITLALLASALLVQNYTLTRGGGGGQVVAARWRRPCSGGGSFHSGGGGSFRSSGVGQQVWHLAVASVSPCSARRHYSIRTIVAVQALYDCKQLSNVLTGTAGTAADTVGAASTAGTRGASTKKADVRNCRGRSGTWIMADVDVAATGIDGDWGGHGWGWGGYWGWWLGYLIWLMTSTLCCHYGDYYIPNSRR